MRVCGRFDFSGSVPEAITNALVEAVKAVPDRIFLDVGTPTSRELDIFDKQIGENLAKKFDPAVKRNFQIHPDVGYNVDLACPDKSLIIEIEKGKSPRLELDVLKFAAAGAQRRSPWKYGALIVPASRVHLKLAGLRTPFEYLQSLSTFVGDTFGCWTSAKWDGFGNREIRLV